MKTSSEPCPDKPLSGTYDDQTRDLVLCLLKHSQWTRLMEIGVDVENGIVTLRGRVPSWGIRDAAERIARQAPGVRSIVNAISVVLRRAS